MIFQMKAANQPHLDAVLISIPKPTKAKITPMGKQYKLRKDKEFTTMNKIIGKATAK